MIRTGPFLWIVTVLFASLIPYPLLTPSIRLTAHAQAPVVPRLPPRPNPGPLPLDRPEARTVPPIGFIAPIVLILLVLCSLVLARIRSLPTRQRERALARLIPLAPAEQALHAAEILRDALVASRGPTWRAKTTEEIADDQALSFALGAERLASLISVLSLADRIKFGGVSSASPMPLAFTELVQDLEAALRQAPSPASPENSRSDSSP